MWQTIESAPKDGRDLILWDTTLSNGVTIGCWLENIHPWGEGDWWVEGGQITGKPSHWMPLPPKP